eukprot:3936227-Rhodomonas_salina.2
MHTGRNVIGDVLEHGFQGVLFEVGSMSSAKSKCRLGDIRCNHVVSFITLFGHSHNHSHVSKHQLACNAMGKRESCPCKN